MQNNASKKPVSSKTLVPEDDPAVLAKKIAQTRSSSGSPATNPESSAKQLQETHEHSSENQRSAAQEAHENSPEKRQHPTSQEKSKEPEKKSHKALIVSLIIIFILLAGAAAFYFLYYKPAQEKKQSEQSASEQEQKTPTSIAPSPEKTEETTSKIYSRLTGEPISSLAEDSAPTYCVQIPNGLDGARPQAGLTHSKVVFEAVAEAGITRLAAIFQNPNTTIGPIRSLRIYYLNWDMPFNCTVVHAGGADDAISALRSYGARELDEDYTYMWRTGANAKMNRLWNNLFTSGERLKAFNDSRGYLSSDIKSFPRYTPDEALKNKVEAQAVNKLIIDQPSEGDTSELKAKVTNISFRFGDTPNFNPVYTYNRETNTYNRSYETGAPHESYDCEGQVGEVTPELSCELKQISPSVVIAMIVQEKRAAYDNYHEDISSLGAGDAYIFQNGEVIVGTWEKSSPTEQIIFRDQSNREISLVPGQTWISAVPAYGTVKYE